MIRNLKDRGISNREIASQLGISSKQNAQKNKDT